MRAVLFLSALLLLAVVPCVEGMSFRPHPAPKVTCVEAIEIATKFAEKDRPDIEDFYIDRVWWGTDPIGARDCWVVSWASREKGWYFAVVYMDRSAAAPPKAEGVAGSIHRIRPVYGK